MADPILLNAPGLAKLVEQLSTLIRADGELREIQGRNAPVAKYFDQPGVFTTIGSVAVTGNVVYKIVQAQSDRETFYQLVLTFDTTSGSGRYTIDGTPVSATVGVGIPSGGCVLTITGHNNIKNFQMMAEGGQTLQFARNLFI